MANLPENQSYIKSSNVSVPDLPNVKAATSTKKSFGGFEYDPAEIMGRINKLMDPANGPKQLQGTPGVDLMDFTMAPSTAAPAIPGGQLIVGANGPGGPLNQSGYGGTFSGAQPSENAMLRNFAGTGQYVTDPNQQGQIIRSNRMSEEDYSWQALKEQALQGRSSRLFQVDHAIPLWLGGTNNAENIQVLTRPQHALKTKAESVALTLFANKVIDRDEAFYLATTWQNRDLTKIPAPQQDLEYEAGQSGGQIPLSKAIEIRKAWKESETATPKLKFGDFWKEVKSNPFIYGFSKGITAGAVKDNPNVDLSSGGDKAANVAGQLAGTLITVTALGKLFGLGARALSARNMVAETLGKTGVVKNMAEAPSKIKYFQPTFTNAKGAYYSAAAKNLAKWTPPVMLYGQTAETFEADPQRIVRFIEDGVYGGLTGFFAPGVSGALKTAVTTGLVSMAADGYAGRTENIMENALINSLTIGALHHVSAPAIQKEAAKTLTEESSRVANNMIAMYLPKIKAVEGKAPVPNYTLEQVNEMEQQLAKTMMEQVGGSADGKIAANLNDEAFQQQAQYLEAALDTLKLRAMPDGPATDAFLTEKMKSWVKTVGKPGSMDNIFGGAMSPRAAQIFEKMPEDLITNPPRFTPSHAHPSGVMRTTGLAENFNADPEAMGKYLARSSEGRASDTLVAIARPERTAFNRYNSENADTLWTDSNPENTLQVIARTLNEKGEVELLPVGYIPQSKRIDGGRNSFNDQPEIREGKFPKYDPTLNKDTIADAMKAEGLDYLFLTKQKAGRLGELSGNPDDTKPYLEFSLGDENWKRSIEWQRTGGSVPATVASDGPEAVLTKINGATNKESKQQAIQEYLDNQELPAYSALTLDNPVVQASDTGGISQAVQHLRWAEETFNSHTTTEIADKIKKYFDINLTPEEASVLFERRRDMTVDDLFKLIEDKSNPVVKEIILGEVKPNLAALTSNDEWDMNQVFNNMRVVGKEAPVPPPVEVAPARELEAVDVSAPKAANELEEVVAPSGPVSPAAQAIVNKAAEAGIVPKTAAVQPLAAPINREPIGPKIVDIASVVIPQGGMRTDRQQMIDSIIKDTVADGKRIIENIRYTPRVGETGYQRALAGVVDNIEPTVNPSTPFAGGVPLSATERRIIQLDAAEELRQIAVNTFRNKIEVSNGVTFKTGAKKGEDGWEDLLAVQSAMDEEALGVRNALVNLRTDMGDEAFETAYKFLNPEGNAKEAGKIKEKVKPTKIGIKGGLLGDTTETVTGRDGKSFDINTEDIAIRRNSGKEVIKDMIDRPQKTAPAGSYMRTFADVIDQGLQKTKLGKSWKTNPNALDLFATVNNKRYVDLWDELLKKSEGDATQPADYLRALGKGQRGKAGDLAKERVDNLYKERMERFDRESMVRNTDDGAEVSGNEVGRSRDVSQLDEDNVPAPALMDRVMAGFTTAVNEGYTPTPEQAINDALQFLFFANKVSPFGFNTSIADTIAPEIAQKLTKEGVRISNVKNPKKKAGTLYAEVMSTKKEADTLLKGDLMKDYKTLVAAKPNYLKIPSIARAGSELEKVKALGEFLRRQSRDWEQGKPAYRGGEIDLKKEDLKFLDAFKKFDNLMLRAKEANRGKEIMKADASVKDGAGYPGPLMDGKGGVIGDAFSGIKNFFSNSHSYEKPKADMSPAGMDLLKPNAPQTLGNGIPKIPQPKTPPVKQGGVTKVKGFDLAPEDFEDLVRIGFGEVSNRAPDKQRLEMQVLLETAANRARSGNYGGDNIIDVLRAPNQYQAFNSPQYNMAKAGTLDATSQAKYDEIRKIVQELSAGPDNFDGALYYVHANDGTIWTGRTQAEAFKAANEHEAGNHLSMRSNFGKR